MTVYETLMVVFSATMSFLTFGLLIVAILSLYKKK